MITYPNRVVTRSNGIPSNQANATRYRKVTSKQSKPYTHPAPFEVYGGRTVSVIETSGWDINTGCDYYGSAPSGYRCHSPANRAPIDNSIARCKSEALAKWQSAVGEQAQLVSNFIERKQALDLVTKTATSLLKGMRAAMRRDLPGLVDAFGAQSTRRQVRALSKSKVAWERYLKTDGSLAQRSRDNAKSLADLWIGWHFGVKPLVADMVSAAEILLEPPFTDGFLIKGTSRVPFDVTVSTGNVGAYYQRTCRHVGYVRGKYTGVVRFDNPNLMLANQLQLTDIGGVIWEATPWSFVGDWFGNFGQMISNYTNPFDDGYTVIDPVYSEKIVDEASFQYRGRLFEFGPYDILRGQSVTRSETFTRSLGVIVPQFYWKSWSTSLSRALTATSLLIQQGVKPLSKKMGSYSSMTYNDRKHAIPHWPSNYDVKYRT